MGMDVFDLFARLSIDISEYATGLNKAKGMAGNIGGAISGGIAKAAKVATAALTAASAATVAFAKGAVQTGLSFDAAMGEVAATAGKTAEELAGMTGTVETSFGTFNGTLRDFAKFMGKNTAFTATEAAQALNYMALAGYNTQQSMQMLPTVLNMAAAGAMDLARASDMVTDISSALGLRVDEDAERIALMADEFAKAASTGNTTVEMLGEAFLTVGGLAKELNGSYITMADGTSKPIDNIEQLEIAFTAMANAGIKGSEAGTHMRNMLLKLSNPTKDGTEALKRMGVAVFDAQGKMNSLDVIFTQLNRSFSKMSQQEKLATIGDLFNARDTASAEALLAAVEQDWNSIGTAILDADGAATQMANTKLDNLQGQITKMKSALEGAKIALSDKLTPSLKNLAAWGTEAIGKLTTAFEEGGVGGAMDAFGKILSDGLSKAIEKLPSLTGVARKLLSTLGRGLLDNIDIVADAATQVLGDVVGIVLDGAPGVLQFVGTFLGKIGTWISENSDMILTGIENLVNSVVKFISENAGKFLSGIIKLRTKIVQRLPDILKPILKALPGIIQDLTQALIDNLPGFINALVQLVSELVPYLPDIVKAIIIALPQILKTIFHSIVENLPQLIAAVVELVAGLVAALPEILGEILIAFGSMLSDLIDLLFPWGDDFLAGIGTIFDGIGEVLAKPIQAIEDFFNGVWEVVSDIMDWIWEKVSGVFQDIYDFLDWINPFSDSAEERAEKERAEIAKRNTQEIIASGGAEAALSQIDDMLSKASKIPILNQLNVNGSITVKGVNNQGELVGSTEITEEQLANMMQKEQRMYTY